VTPMYVGFHMAFEPLQNIQARQRFFEDRILLWIEKSSL
jgi:hypothetical protein